MEVFPGFGTLVNITTVLVGSAFGVLLGHRLPQRTRSVVTDALGLVTLLIAGLSVSAVRDPRLVAAIGANAPVLVVLGSVLVGGIAGSLLAIEDRLECAGGGLQRLLSRGTAPSAQRQRFVEAFVTSSLVFCVGPLTVLGSISDGIGAGSEQLILKSVLDGFASVAFAASLGWGVAASALSVLVVQGSLTLVGVLLGAVVAPAPLAALTATGGLLLAGVGLRLLRIRPVPVADLLPALVVAPLLTMLVSALR
jgi:uncharacterized membrane protein YqgA involved in biofilm formation